MVTELIAMGLFAVPCAIFGVMVAFLLRKWAAGRTVAMRTFIASVASTIPALGVVAYVAGGSPTIIFLMSPDEFLIPFVFQIALILAVAAPAVWFVSRRRPRTPTNVFE